MATYDKVKDLVKEAFVQAFEGQRYGGARLPKEILFEGAKYTPQELLQEVRGQTGLGEKILKTVYNTATDFEKELQMVPNPDEPIFGGGNEEYSPRGLQSQMSNMTDLGKKMLVSNYRLTVVNLWFEEEKPQNQP